MPAAQGKAGCIAQPSPTCTDQQAMWSCGARLAAAAGRSCRRRPTAGAHRARGTRRRRPRARPAPRCAGSARCAPPTAAACRRCCPTPATGRWGPPPATAPARAPTARSTRCVTYAQRQEPRTRLNKGRKRADPPGCKHEQRGGPGLHRRSVAQEAQRERAGEGLQVARLGQPRQQALRAGQERALLLRARAQVQVQAALEALLDERAVRGHAPQRVVRGGQQGRALALVHLCQSGQALLLTQA